MRDEVGLRGVGWVTQMRVVTLTKIFDSGMWVNSRSKYRPNPLSSYTDPTTIRAGGDQIFIAYIFYLLNLMERALVQIEETPPSSTCDRYLLPLVESPIEKSVRGVERRYARSSQGFTLSTTSTFFIETILR